MPPDEYPKIYECSADELHRRLVEDAVALRPTPVAWAVLAYGRIGELTGRGSEAAFQDVVAEKAALTGNHVMPMG